MCVGGERLTMANLKCLEYRAYTDAIHSVVQSGEAELERAMTIGIRLESE